MIRSCFLGLVLTLAIACDDGAAPSDGGGGPGDGDGAGGPGSSTTAGSGETTAVTSATGSSTGTTSGVGGGVESNATLFDVQQKSSHNSYERLEPLFDQMAYHRVRSLELDIHVDKGASWPPVAGDWYVYHDGPGDPTTCHRLSDCLRELRAFHDAVPDHELITIFVDLKTDWAAGGHQPVDFDARVGQTFSPDELVTPSFLMDACPGAADLRDAVAGRCSWPTLASMRGRFAFALTGGGGCAATGKLPKYVESGSTALDRTAFIAPTPTTGCDLPDYEADKLHVVIFNFPPEEASKAANARAGGVLSRVWDLDDQGLWSEALGAGAHFLGTNKVNLHQDPWATTHSAGGYPFRCFGNCALPSSEIADIFGVEVESGDMWASSDSMTLLSEDVGAVGTDTTAFVSVPSSHVEPWAKGCLVARAGAGAGSASFAVCRPADEHVIRVQVRATNGASTDAYEVPINDSNTIDDDAAAYLRLVVEPSGGGATARGYASQDGITWKLIRTQSFGVPLPIQGVAASGHGSSSPVRFLFGNVVRTIEGGTPAVIDLVQLAKSELGGASATAFSGPLP
ncbi:MAG: hypothetical protein HOV80_39535 [Polyangiaceae bacterium]|nr:hypothetical protein [Polyangiaceae bacterium]